LQRKSPAPWPAPSEQASEVTISVKPSLRFELRRLPRIDAGPRHAVAQCGADIGPTSTLLQMAEPDTSELLTERGPKCCTSQRSAITCLRCNFGQHRQQRCEVLRWRGQRAEPGKALELYTIAGLDRQNRRTACGIRHSLPARDFGARSQVLRLLSPSRLNRQPASCSCLHNRVSVHPLAAEQ
jgi:hypothetical protein